MDKRIFILPLILVPLLTAGVFASYSLCLGTFCKSEAEDFHRQLALRGYPVYLLYGDSYEVRMGSFETKEEAYKEV